MRKQHYEDYVVNDVRSFPQCLPLKGNPPRDLSFEEFKKWAKKNLSEEGQKIYDNAKNAKASGLSPPPGLITANIFVNARKQTTEAKSSECSNFARHAIGTMIQNKDITDYYNTVYAGIMGGAHNIAILIPKEHTLALNTEKTPPTFTGNLPKGSLMIDPWALGMGKSFDSSFGCSPDEFAFRNSLKPMTVHYQSKDHPEQVEHVQSVANQDDSTLQFSASPKTPRSSSKPTQQTKLEFHSLDPVPENFKPLLKCFDEQLKEVKEQALSLETRGYPTAAKEAEKFYNNLVDERNKFIKQEPNTTNKKAFVDNCSKHIELAQNSELKNARGWKSIFFNIAKAVAFVATVGFYTKQTTSIQKVNSIKDALNNIKPKGEGEELQGTISPSSPFHQHSTNN